MFKKLKLTNIDDYFKKMSERENAGVYFVRIIYYGKKTENFLKKYLQEIKNNGIYIEGKLQNPDLEKIEFFRTISNNRFEQNIDFFMHIFSKLLPQLNLTESRIISEGIYDILTEMSSTGQSENIIENFYIKLMCWIYYRFQGILKVLNSDRTVKILYNGDISNHELKLMRMFSRTGCDIVILELNGDNEYLKLDLKSEISDIFSCGESEKFPDKFSIKEIINNLQYEQQVNKNIESIGALQIINTNQWIKDDVFSASLKKNKERGNGEKETEDNTFYNIFVQINGVENVISYNNELVKWKLKINDSKKKFVIIDGRIKNPETHEVEKINKKTYVNNYDLIANLSQNISFTKSIELEKLLKKAFIELMKEEIESTISKLQNRGICILCWINRYIPLLFVDKNLTSNPVFIYFNGNTNANDTFFLRLLSRLPVDVFILLPDLSINGSINDTNLLKINHNNSLPTDKFPVNASEVQFGTIAYHAEQELVNVLYRDTGLYKNKQFKNAIPITLETTAEEVDILWNQESKYRPNFESFDDKVMVPVICSKLLGIPDRNIDAYWIRIKKLLTDDYMLLKEFPYVKSKPLSNDKNFIFSFINNGKIDIKKILDHPSYKYKFLRREMQEYMLTGLQKLLDSRIIKGTFENGTEYRIINLILDLNIDFVKLLNSYDFTKKIPKLVCIDTTENIGTLDDGVLIAYARQLGFDIVFFVPTGYQSIEIYFSTNFFIEHQIGEYMYNLTVPNFDKIKNIDKESIIKKFFRR
ncbi:MAG: YceG family protein [Fusobacteriaceae bacterium]|jgi:hypothetical protein|nr:YceG family protein [Fusobacteriaceae bacterium]